MARRRSGARAALAAALVTPLLLISTVVTLSATSISVTNRAKLPSDAFATGQIATINAVSCGGVNTCSGVGSYLSSAGHLPAIFHEVNGSWLASTKVTLPADAVASNGSSGSSFDQLNAVSCPTPSNCVAVGTYRTASGFEPLVVSENNAIWAPAVRATLPAGASTTGQLGALFAVSCTGIHTCVTGGTYLAGSNQQPVIDQLSAGVWAAPLVPALPVGAISNSQVAAINSVFCSGTGSCLAVGSFVNAAGFQAVVLNESAGSWSNAASTVTVALPANAISAADAVANGLNAVSCPSAGNCQAVGQYATSTGYAPMTATETDGSWSTAVEVTTPSGLVATLNSVSCVAVGTCVAVGSYGSSTVQVPMMATEVASTWSAGSLGVLPLDALASNSGRFNSVRCFAATECVVVGSYRTSAGFEGLDATPTTPPGAPTNVVATSANSSATIQWRGPAYVGNTSITGYTVTAAPGNGTCSTVSTLACRITKLTNGVQYRFQVTATNVVGSSARSLPSNSVTPATIPSAPTITSVVPLKGGFRVTFSAPPSNGGLAISTYDYTVDAGSTWHVRSSGTTSTILLIVALARHHRYHVAIRAVNPVGTGASSHVVAATTM